MIKIPQNIQELRSYKPGKPIPVLKEEYGLNQTAILWNNENNLGVSQKAVNAMQKAALDCNTYPDPLSNKLRKQLADLNGRSMDEISVANGSEELLSNINKAFIEPGGELLTSAGTFVAVYIWAKAANVNLKTVPLDQGLGFNLKAIEHAITENTRVIYLSNPNNPTGTYISKDELENFLSKVPENIVVVIDEAYFEFAQALVPNYPDSTKIKRDNIITLRTFSKAYGLAGIRVGYSVANEALTEALLKVKMTFAPSNISQAGAEAVLSDQEYLRLAIQTNTKGIQLFYALFNELNFEYVRSAANFVTLKLASQLQAEQLTLELLKNGVFVRHLIAFGLPSCIRVSVGTDEENLYCAQIFRKIKA